MSSTLNGVVYTVVDSVGVANKKITLTLPLDAVIFIRDGDDALRDKFANDWKAFRSDIRVDGVGYVDDDDIDDSMNWFTSAFVNIDRCISADLDSKNINVTILDDGTYTANHCMLSSDNYNGICKCFTVVFWTAL